jgi:DNA-binding PadR family transcriptional regulator
MTVTTVIAPTAPANTFTASPDDTIRILKALATRQQLPSDELRRASGFEGNLAFGGCMIDLRNKGLVDRWQTREGAPRSAWYGPGFQMTAEGRKYLAAHLMAAADVTPAPEVKPAPPVVICEPAPAADPALAVLKAIAARPNGALDRDVARSVYSPNNREAAYAQLRARGLIRTLPVPLLPITYQITDAGRAHLVALEPQPCRALVVRGCVALMVLPSSTGA